MAEGAPALALRELDVRTTVRAVVTALMPRALSRGVEVALEMPMRPVVACLDHDRLGDAVEALLALAIDEAEAGRTIGVMVDVTAGRLRVAVADGGLPPDRALFDGAEIGRDHARLGGVAIHAGAHGGRLHAEPGHVAFWVPFISLGMPCVEGAFRV